MKQKYVNIEKVGLAIIAFEGTEHLFNIISSIRESVDYVSIGLLKVSYHGDKIPDIDLQEIYRLRDEDHIVDNIVDIELDTTKQPRVQETDKRNILIQDAEEHGCSHCIVIDSDEYYTKKSFDYALAEIDKHDYDITYCQYVNYIYDYKHYLKYPFAQGMYVPFVTKVSYRHSFDCTDFDKPSDPTRRYVRPYDRIDKVTGSDGQVHEVKHYTVDYHLFEWNEVKMHHLSWIRADIRKKLENWSSKTVFENYNDLIDQAVYNFENFDEEADVQEVKMLFHTPENKVEAVKFPKQYIYPKVDIKTRLRPVKEYKKMLFLTMSADIEIFNKLEEVSNETWRNVDTEKYGNINAEFWTYTDAKLDEETHVDKEHHIIYIKRDDYQNDLINATYSKTIEALSIIKEMNIQYDYLIRTNNSIWVNVPLLNEFLAHCTDDSKIYSSNLCAAFWSAFNLFTGGQMMIWSHRNVDIILNISGGLERAKVFEREIVSCDDNMICGRVNDRLIRLGLPYGYTYHSLGGKYLPHKTISEDDVKSFEYVQYQIKTFDVDIKERPQYDIDKMRYVDNLWKSKTDVDIESLYEDMMKHYDESIIVFPQTRQEWFDIKEDKSNYIWDSKYVMPRNQALAYLKERQVACGYHPGTY